MKKFVLLFLLIAPGCFSGPTRSKDAGVARWKKEAKSVTIVRDDWGIAHIYGKTDADAVFGMEHAQAEDDFNRVEVRV